MPGNASPFGDDPTIRSSSTPEGWHTVTPRIVPRDAAGLVTFLKHVFDATGDHLEAAPSVIRIGALWWRTGGATPGRSPPTGELRRPRRADGDAVPFLVGVALAIVIAGFL